MFPTEEIVSGTCLILKYLKSCERFLYISLIICIFYKGAATSEINLYHFFDILFCFSFN